MWKISFVDILNSIIWCHDIFGEGGFGINFGCAAYGEYFFCWYIEFNQMVSWYIWWRRVWHKFWMGSTADVWSRRQFYSCPLPQSVSLSQCWKVICKNISIFSTNISSSQCWNLQANFFCQVCLLQTTFFYFLKPTLRSACKCFLKLPFNVTTFFLN